MSLRARCVLLGVSGLVLASTGWAFFEASAPPGVQMAAAAAAFLESLNDSQRAAAMLPYDAPQRVDWHFIPKDKRKGVQFRDLTPLQRDGVLSLLRVALSQLGYDRSVRTMEIETLLKELEKGNSRVIRDPERYYITLFGPPGEGRWGLSFEGHHLSLNFVMEHGRVISSSPQAFCANPAVVNNENSSGIPVGTRLIEFEETLAFELLGSLSTEQRQTAVIAAEPLKEVRNAGVPHPPAEPAAGLALAAMTAPQQSLLRRLVEVYCLPMPGETASTRLAEIAEAGWEQVHFAWAGASEPGVGHYYRVQGPTFLIEFVNTQPDAAGNVANHIHSLWRDMRGDFALPISQ